MGQIVFWMEVAITSALIFALVMALLARIKRLLLRRILTALALLIVILLWAAIVCGFSTIQIFYGGAEFPTVSSAIFGGVLLVSVIIVWLRARRPSQLVAGFPAAAQWRLGRTSLFSLAGVLLTSTTFWNLDLAARQEIASLRTEAGAIALAVSPPCIPDLQNAAVLYRQAWEMLDAELPTGDGNSWRDMVSEWLSPESGKFDPDNKEMLAFLERNKVVISILHQAGQLPGCNFGMEYNPPAFDIVCPNLTNVRSLAKLLSISTRVNATHNRLNEAMEDLSAEYAVANHCIEDPTLIALLVGIAIDAMSFNDLEYALNHALPTSGAIAELKLNPSMSLAGAFQRSLRMEDVCGLSTFTLIAGTGQIFQMMGKEEYSHLGERAAAMYRVFLLTADVSAYRKELRKIQDLARQPYYVAVSKWKESDKNYNNYENVRMGGILTSLMAPSFSKAAEVVARADAQYRLALLADASVRYRLKNGTWPEKLELLSPQYIFTVPVDPFTGKSMKIARKEKQFILYSVGPDLVDDGGAPFDKEKKGDIAITIKDFPAAK